MDAAQVAENVRKQYARECEERALDEEASVAQLGEGAGEARVARAATMREKADRVAEVAGLTEDEVAAVRKDFYKRFIEAAEQTKVTHMTLADLKKEAGVEGGDFGENIDAGFGGYTVEQHLQFVEKMERGLEWAKARRWDRTPVDR